MTLKPLGDAAWLVEFPTGTPLARVLGMVAALEQNRPPGVLDVVSSFASLAVHFEAVDALEIRDWLETAMHQKHQEYPTGREIEIPVRYDGMDLEEVAAQVGMSVEDVIALHSGAQYTVAAVGFSPGFPYLSGLPPRLGLPRRKTPRLSVFAGSVAIGGGQAGIYPFTSPGGWHVLGRTGIPLFDPAQSRPALLRHGDRVKFRAVDRLEIAHRNHLPAPHAGRIEVVHPGSLTTIQDLGRPGYEACGVSPGGAVDRRAVRTANLAVGNDEGAAALEICLSGPLLKFHADAVVAFIDGCGSPRRVKAGETVDFSKPTHGARAYLAIAGGFQADRVLGSAATDLRAGFGGHAGRALQAGDWLDFGPATTIPTPGDWHVGRDGRDARIELRFLPGVQQDEFTEQAHHRLRTGTYQLTPNSDRMGARLSGPRLDLQSPREMLSQPVACGSVQVPPDGQPIVLLAERQTIGGYPQIGHVISVDLPQLARAWPGTRIEFREVTWQEAQQLQKRERRDFAWLRTGLELLKSKP
ncbi:MAG: 5-oxoprolinase subunit PxpB [Akkermansiaceae bacterium]